MKKSLTDELEELRSGLSARRGPIQSHVQGNKYLTPRKKNGPKPVVIPTAWGLRRERKCRE